MISSFAQVPIFLRPGNIHVPVIFEWSTSSVETTKAGNNCVTDSALVPSIGNVFGKDQCHQLLPGSATVPLIGNVFGKTPATKHVFITNVLRASFFSSSALGPIYLFLNEKKHRCCLDTLWATSFFKCPSIPGPKHA
jgi:hypothetical protein